jgi:hypothetical protein
MCTLVSKQIIEFYAKYDDEGKDKYDEGDYEKIEDSIEELKDDWVDGLFDTDCSLDFDEFVEKLC